MRVFLYLQVVNADVVADADAGVDVDVDADALY